MPEDMKNREKAVLAFLNTERGLEQHLKCSGFVGEAVNADSYLSQPLCYMLLCISFLVLPPLFLLCFNIISYGSQR